MDDEPGAFCRLHHILPVHGIASHALDAIDGINWCRSASHRPHPPAALQ